jgi:hypothetical protein
MPKKFTIGKKRDRLKKEELTFSENMFGGLWLSLVFAVVRQTGVSQMFLLTKKNLCL